MKNYLLDHVTETIVGIAAISAVGLVAVLVALFKYDC